MSRNGRGGKSPVICEVCPDHVRHHTSITVGHKASGTPRVIHDRAKCRQRWARERDRIMARWPENRQPVATPLQQFTEPAHMIREDGRITELHGLGRSAPALELVQGLSLDNATGVMQALENAQAAVLERPAHVIETHDTRAMEGAMQAAQEAERGDRTSRYAYKPELDEVIIEYFKTHPWRRGAAMVLYGILGATKPELLIDLNGKPIHRYTLSGHCGAVLDKAARKRQQEQVAAVIEAERIAARVQVADAAVQQKAAELGGRIATGVMALVARCDVATLQAVADIMDGR